MKKFNKKKNIYEQDELQNVAQLVSANLACLRPGVPSQVLCKTQHDRTALESQHRGEKKRRIRNSRSSSAMKGIEGQSGLHETLSQKKKSNNNNNNNNQTKTPPHFTEPQKGRNEV